LEESQKKFGEPGIENYETVYDGELATNDLEGIYTKFNIDHPYGYEGHSLSMSDVVELYDDEGSIFHYVDRMGFQEISFKQLKQDMQMKM